MTHNHWIHPVFLCALAAACGTPSGELVSFRQQNAGVEATDTDGGPAVVGSSGSSDVGDSETPAWEKVAELEALLANQETAKQLGHAADDEARTRVVELLSELRPILYVVDAGADHEVLEGRYDALVDFGALEADDD